MSVTTLRINDKVKKRLDNLRIHPRETYNDIIDRLITLAIDEEPLSEETLLAIEEGLDDIRKGRTRSLTDVANELGI